MNKEMIISSNGHDTRVAILEDDQVVEDILGAGVRLLFVGLGCPKQERWMAEHRDRLPLVTLGVGAAFEFPLIVILLVWMGIMTTAFVDGAELWPFWNAFVEHAETFDAEALLSATGRRTYDEVYELVYASVLVASVPVVSMVMSANGSRVAFTSDRDGNYDSTFTRLMTDIVAAGLPTHRVFVSHLTEDEFARLSASYPDYELRPRVGTGLWLGDRGALSVRAAVLDAHQVERGDVFGYRGRTAPKSGTILVVSGGTAHGIGLEAPPAAEGLRQRAVTLAKGGLDAAGFVRSPYTIGGKHRLFAEPPHMQASMLFLPHGAPVPEVGEEVDVRVRFTTTTVDRTVVS